MEKTKEILEDKWLNKEVYITSSLEGFFNRETMELMNVDFKGTIKKIQPELNNPLYVEFNNGKSSLNLSPQHLRLITDKDSVEKIKNNLKFGIIFVISKEVSPEIKIQGMKEKGTQHFVANSNTLFGFSGYNSYDMRNSYKDFFFSTLKDAQNYLNSQEFEDLYNKFLSTLVKDKTSFKIDSYYFSPE